LYVLVGRHGLTAEALPGDLFAALPGRPKGVRAYRFDGCELNLNTRRLMTSEGRLVRLTNADFNLLVVLLASPQRIFTRDQLLDLS
jgi:two-component system OmpR family response regulator